MNATEYARHRGITKMRVSQYIAEGKISAKKVGRGYEIDPVVADRELEGSMDIRQQHGPPAVKIQPRRAQRVASPPQTPPEAQGGITYAQAQRAREVYRAERERLALEKDKCLLVAAADVRREVVTLTRAIRDNMLAIPDRIASQLAATVDVFDVHKLLEDEIRTALRMLADG